MCGSEGSIFLRDDRLAVWEFDKGRSSDKRIMAQLGVKGRTSGAGAADPAAIALGRTRKISRTRCIPSSMAPGL